MPELEHGLEPQFDEPANHGHGTARRTLLKGVGLSAAATALLSACNSNSSASASGGVGNFPETPKYKFVFVNHVTTNPFFQATQYGIQDACALLHCDYQWTGSETSQVSEMVTAMKTAITSKADGIAVALIDKSAFNAPTEQAMSAGIPVVSYNADGSRTGAHPRQAYIGQDLFASGQAMGERIVELVPSGDVALFIATPGQLNI